MNDNIKIFLRWFFLGNFFKSLKNAINEEGQRGENAFRIVFFNGDQGLVNEFMQCNVPRLSKGNINDEHVNFFNKEFLCHVKEMIVGEISLLDDNSSSINNRIQLHVNFVDNPEFTVSNFMINQYARFRKSNSCISYVKALNGQVCSYCDKGIIDCTDSHFYGDLDHVHDKSTYYYYALNIYNLAPCCKVCNQKKGKYSVIFNPLTMKLDDVFTFRVDDSDLLNITVHYNDKLDVDIKLKSLSSEMDPVLENLNKRLALNDRYKNSGLVLNYLSQLKKVYTQSYLDEVTKLLGDSYDNDDLKRFLLGDFSISDTTKIQPLTKLVRDLSSQIGLFENDD
ncbi:hypothetical protein ACTVM2_06670 [Serratia nevei]|uniref:hypothetical protein n=1 Tax=Serratia nevei TaxID=2703794 RepID=UPI003FA71357